MLTFSTENSLSLEPKSGPHRPRRSAAQQRFAKEEAARTKQHLLCKTKPISQGLIMTVTSAITRLYEEKSPIEAPKNKANFKAHRLTAPHSRHRLVKTFAILCKFLKSLGGRVVVWIFPTNYSRKVVKTQAIAAERRF